MMFWWSINYNTEMDFKVLDEFCTSLKVEKTVILKGITNACYGYSAFIEVVKLTFSKEK
jgi:hypothetical protein